MRWSADFLNDTGPIPGISQTAVLPEPRFDFDRHHLERLRGRTPIINFHHENICLRRYKTLHVQPISLDLALSIGERQPLSDGSLGLSSDVSGLVYYFTDSGNAQRSTSACTFPSSPR